MKILTANALTQVATNLGTKPFILLEISWVNGVPNSLYADKDFEAYKGKILTITGLDDVVNVTGGSKSSQATVTLDDTDGTLKTIIDANDIHKRPCWIYQQFSGLSSADKFLLFRGEISSPIVWDEGARQLSFDIISTVESVEIGFSIEEGQFPLLPPNLVGKAWPLAFGSVVNVPAVQITSPREGILANGFGIHDWSIRRKLQLANAICCPNNSLNNYQVKFGSASILAQPTINPNTQLSTVPVTATNVGSVNGTSSGTGTGVSLNLRYGADPNCIKNKCDTIATLQYNLDQQMKFEFPSFRVFNGHQFAQNKTITLSIGGAYVVGSFSGETFTVQKYIHKDAVDKDLYHANNYTDPPTAAELDFIINDQVPNAAFTRGEVLQDFGTDNPGDAIAAFHAFRDAGPSSIIGACLNNQGMYFAATDCESLSLDSLNAYPSGSFQWCNAGEKVTYAFDEEVVYVANILPSTVRCVSAYRTLDNGERLLLVVPPEYYTIRTTDYFVYNVVEIVFGRLLSLLALGWEDQIYVTLDSSVGPNTVDIIEWLINTYQGSAAEGLGVHTHYNIDDISFDTVRAQIDNYPSSFAYLDRRDIATALNEISMQARCALWLQDDTYYIKYLAANPTTVDTITEDHINQNSLQLTSTTTEELVTKMMVTWNDDYAIPSKLIILRNNVNKYGTVEQKFDFYIYNMYSLVQKSAIFWLIRKSNTWRRLTFKTPLVKMALESFDDVSFTLSDVSDGSFKGMIETATFNADDNTMTFDVWTDILAGTRVEYPWAYPAYISPTQLWPPDIAAQGIGFSVVAPIGHPLSSSASPYPVNVPDDVTAPNFLITNCANGNNTDSANTNYCCISPLTTVEPSEFCQFQQPFRVDDANDLKPPPRTDASCPGALNLGVDPILAQLPPKFNSLQRQVNNAQSRAASAAGAAYGAGGGKGGDGNQTNQGTGSQTTKTDPLSKLPQAKKNPPKAPGTKPTCTMTITVCWFPIIEVAIGNLITVCLPAGELRCETYTFGGCRNSTRTDLTTPQAQAAAQAKLTADQAATTAKNASALAPGDAGLKAAADAAVANAAAADAAYQEAITAEGAQNQFFNQLASLNVVPADGHNICPANSTSGPCCNATILVTDCKLGGCNPGTLDGEFMSVDKTAGDTNAPGYFSGILFDGKGGFRGAAADGAKTDTDMGINITTPPTN